MSTSPKTRRKFLISVRARLFVTVLYKLNVMPYRQISLLAGVAYCTCKRDCNVFL
jgi:hypothetical protein